MSTKKRSPRSPRPVPVPDAIETRPLTVGDTTELRIGEGGRLFLAAIVDLYSRFVVGWALSAVNDRKLAIRALDMALRRRCPDSRLVHHSDQGSPLRKRRLPARAFRAPHHMQHEPSWQLLQQRRDGELVLNLRRQSAVFDDYRRAQTELSRRQVEVEEIKCGIRNAAPPEKTFGDLCDYWLENPAPSKRSGKDDESVVRKRLRPYFGAISLRQIGVEEGDDYLNLKLERRGALGQIRAQPLYAARHDAASGDQLQGALLAAVSRFRKPKVALFSRDYQWLLGPDPIPRTGCSAIVSEILISHSNF